MGRHIPRQWGREGGGDLRRENGPYGQNKTEKELVKSQGFGE